MKWNAVVAVGALIAVALVGIVSLNGRNTQAADPPKPATEIGRYQFILHKGLGGGDEYFLFDTATGHFYQDNRGKWEQKIDAVKPK